MSPQRSGPSYLNALPPPGCAQIMGFLHQWHAAPGKVLFQQGDIVQGLYFIEAGSVICDSTLPDGRHMTLGFALPGGVFGDFEVFGSIPAQCSATVYSAVTGWYMPAVHALAALAQVPGYAKLITKSMARAASTFQVAYMQTVLREPHELIAQALLSSTQPLQQLSQATLANILGLTRQCVNKHLRQWETSGWVKIDYAGVRVIDREAIKQLLQK